MHDNTRSLASVTAQSLLAVLSVAMNGGRPVFDIPLVDYFSREGGYSVTDSGLSASALASIYSPAAGTFAQTQPNAAAFVTQSVPTVMQVGRQYNVAVTMRNTGTNTWTSAANYNIGSQNPQDNSTWGRSRAALPVSVAPGAEVTITFSVIAPSNPGTYNFRWQMVQDGVEWFGDFTPNVSVYVASAAMVARWKFDDGSGTAAADSSGNGNTGTLRNGPAWGAGTVGTGALDFDGVNDAVSVAGSATVNSVSNDFTVAFWAYPRSPHEIDPEGTAGVSGTSGQRYVWGPGFYDSNNGGAGAGISVGTNGVSIYEHAGNYMPAPLVYQGALSGWTHVTVVYQNRQPQLYLNGALMRTGQTSPKASVGIIPSDIGGMVYGYFNGQLDDVRLYNGVLTAGEIAGLAGAPGRLVGHWKFDEGSGAAAADSSGNANAGTLQGGAAWAAGKVGAGAVSLDGVDDQVQVGVRPSLSMTTAATFSAWLYPTGAGSDVTMGGIVVNKEGEYEIARFPDGTIQWAFANTNPGWNWVNTGYVAPLNQWTYLAVTYDGGTVKTYANGQLVHTYAGSGVIGDVLTSQNDFRIGGRQGIPQNFRGRIDDVKVYNGVLSAQDVGALAGKQGTGLTGEYYDNDDFTGYVMTRSDAAVNFDWGGGAPSPSIGADFFSVRWAGVVVPRYSETYTFYTYTDDGVRLWVDGQLLVDKWLDQGPTEWSGSVTLEAGRAYAIRIEFFEHWGGRRPSSSGLRRVSRRRSSHRRSFTAVGRTRDSSRGTSIRGRWRGSLTRPSSPTGRRSSHRRRATRNSSPRRSPLGPTSSTRRSMPPATAPTATTSPTSTGLTCNAPRTSQVRAGGRARSPCAARISSAALRSGRTCA